MKTRRDHISETEAKWFAIYTRNKAEKLVCDKLQKKGIEAYVPLLRYVKKYTSKTKEVAIPLINCYVFVKITKEDYVKVLQTEHVISFLKLRGAIISIPQKEIEILRWVVGENMVKSVIQGSFEKGTSVEIIGGKLTGMKGIILRKASKKSFVVSLDTMGISLELEVPEEMMQQTKKYIPQAS